MFYLKNFSFEFDDNIVTDTTRRLSKNINGWSLSANDKNDDAKQRSSTNNVNFQTDRALFAHLTSSALHVRVGTSAYRSAANVPPLRLPSTPTTTSFPMVTHSRLGRIRIPFLLLRHFTDHFWLYFLRKPLNVNPFQKIQKVI